MWGNRPRLSDYLQQGLQSALSELNSLSADYLLHENEDLLVAELLQRNMPRPIEIDWSGLWQSGVSETTIRFQDRFDFDEEHTVPASKLTLHFPFTGSKELLEYQATTYNITAPSAGKVLNSAIVLEIVEPNLTPELVSARIDSVKSDMNRRAEWANTDLQNFLPTAERELRTAYASRKQRILNDRALEEALQIPIAAKSTPRQPVPARRKHVSLDERRASSGSFAPEPALNEAMYQDVLQQVHGWARSMERSPRTCDKLDEEELRDLLLGTLNGYWEGQAGGELFNGAGKTDILIRHNDRNVFIGELKIWRGPKTVGATIDQMLSYMVWRDSKAAIVMFIKAADPAAIIEKLHDAVEDHPKYVMTKRSRDRAKQVDYIFTADEEGRRISLAVIPVVLTIPAKTAAE